MPAGTVVEEVGYDGDAGFGGAYPSPTLTGYVAAGEVLLALAVRAGGQIQLDDVISDSKGNTWVLITGFNPLVQFGSVAVWGCRVARGKELSVGDQVTWPGGVAGGPGAMQATCLWLIRARNCALVPLLSPIFYGGGGGISNQFGGFGFTTQAGALWFAFGALVAKFVAAGGWGSCSVSSINPADANVLIASRTTNGVDISVQNGLPEGTTSGWGLKCFLTWANPVATPITQFGTVNPPVFYGLGPGTAYYNMGGQSWTLLTVGSILLQFEDPCTGLPVRGLRVDLSPDQETQYTDSNGEVLWAGLADGTYAWTAGPDFDLPEHIPQGSIGTTNGNVLLAYGQDFEERHIQISRPNGCPTGVGDGDGGGGGGDGGDDGGGTSGSGVGIECAEPAGVGTASECAETGGVGAWPGGDD